ncbi:hypothetical protein E4T56_gene11334, partial [Termitomyces sp. T112]
MANSQPKPFHSTVPNHLHDFEDVFSKASFNLLPECKQWDHVIELIPNAEPSSCKVYPLAPWGAVAQLAPSRPKAGHMICECKVGVSTLAECACVEKHLRHHVGYFNAAGKPPPARARLARLCSAGR